MPLKIERFERIFLFLTVALLTVFVVAIVLSVAEGGVHLPDDEHEMIDPTAVRTTPPFDQPGVFEIEPGRYEVVVIAQTWSFEPDTITIPAGADVTFIVTSADVIHGFQIWNTTVNAMAIPGQVTRVRTTFEQAGEYQLVCHEYCGIGHHGMFGKVVVTP